ncbi:MAG: hypothetical protein ACYTHJ_10970 [Planctomycetota bacterium]|jgi:hypothetical protein
MKAYIRFFSLSLCAMFTLGLVIACESSESSHKVTRTRTYDDEPEQKRSESDELDGEYKMQSEGDMTGP